MGIVAFSQTTIPPASTWTPARNIINANFVNTYDSIAANRLRVNILNDSILAYATAINLRLLKSDTASMLANYTRNGELNSALAAKVNVSDTAAMLAHYALTSELGDAGTSIGDVRDEIADSLNVLRPLYVAIADTAAMLDHYAKLTDLSEGGIGIGAVQDEIADSLNVLRAAVTVGNGTKAPYFDGSQDGGNLLYFYGSNGFWTALQGGAPTANRSYRLPIAALPSAGTTSLMNIDEYGNMGFVASTTYAPTANPTFTGVQKVSTTDTLATKAYARSVGGGGGGVVGIALNSGTITLTGDGGTADDITFYTNGDGSYDLPAGGGNLTIMSQVQGWINDSLDARIGDGVELSTIAVMKADSTGGPGHYASWYDMTTGLTSKVNVSDTTSMLSHYILASEVSSTYAPLSSPNFSGTPLLATSDTLATQAYARSYGGSGTVTTDDVEALITANARLNVDTIPLFVFGLGSGVAADTAVFNNNAIAGVFYNSGADTLHITSIRGVLSEGSGTETIGVQVSWHTTFKSGSATNLNASAYTVTSITTGDEDTSFANNEIPPNAWVWCTISGVSAGNKPSLLIVTMTGYKIRNW